MSASQTAGQECQSVLPDDRDAAGFVVSGVVTALTLTVAFSLLALGVESFWIAFVVGFGVVLPMALAAVAARWPEETDNDDPTPIEELQLRYARGELTEAEFERRVERLVETEAESAPDRRSR